MPQPRLHARIVQYPFTACLQGGRLDSYHEERHGKRLDFVLDLQSFEHRASPELIERDEILFERIRGNFVPARLTFSGVTEPQGGRFFANLSSLPPDSPERTVSDMLSWRQPERRDIFYLIFMRMPQVDDLRFFARHAKYERLSGRPRPVILERDWSPAPAMPDRLVPRPETIHRRFGGDPVTVQLAGRPYHRLLFTGGTDIQGLERPDVAAVLNLGEEPSRWATKRKTCPADCWVNKGEGTDGMSLDEMRAEAGWVIARLQAGQRVLVHCVAGMNRSATICCAVLILLEGLTAEQALNRVRQHHPWARPDSKHWLKLRWLAQTTRQG